MAEKSKKPVKEKTAKKPEKAKETKIGPDKKKTEKVKMERPKSEKKVEVPEKKIETNLKVMHLRPLITEKAVMMIEAQNVLTFETSMSENKIQIKKEVEGIFEVKVESVRTLIRKGKKYAYVKLNPKDLAIDIATKLGMI